MIALHILQNVFINLSISWENHFRELAFNSFPSDCEVWVISRDHLW